MSTNQPFSDPLITMMRDGVNIPFVSITEEIYVDTNGMALLTEIPDEFTRVKILTQTGGANGTSTIDGGTFTDTSSSGTETIINPSFFEIEDGIPDVNQFICDYTNGTMTFNQSQIGAKFLVQYLGRGYKYLASSRIYYDKNLDGSIITIKDILDSSTTTIANIQTAENNANTATNNANAATANFQTLLNEQLVIYKPSVPTYADIATTYPTPSLGWTVTEKQYGIRYRYDGIAWVEIGTSQAGDGFNVYIGASAPANTNILWLEVPNANRMTRIVKSPTAPTDTSVIWWEP